MVTPADGIWCTQRATCSPRFPPVLRLGPTHLPDPGGPRARWGSGAGAAGLWSSALYTCPLRGDELRRNEEQLRVRSDQQRRYTHTSWNTHFITHTHTPTGRMSGFTHRQRVDRSNEEDFRVTPPNNDDTFLKGPAAHQGKYGKINQLIMTNE